MIVLVDMDGTMVDWGAGYGRGLDVFGEAAANIPRHHDQRSYNLQAGLNEDEKEIVSKVMATMNYRSLEPLPGAVDALHGMLDHGFDVLICTAPWSPNKLCMSDKERWIEEHLGLEWHSRIIISHDKTLVHGTILVDDKPEIKGRISPSWQQIMFDQPYNRSGAALEIPRLLSWEEWDNNYIEEYY